MECLGKKRKGVEISIACPRDQSAVAVSWSHLSLEDYSRRRKKCKEVVVTDANSNKNVVIGVVTAPPCGSAHSDPSGRGLKRKIGCIDVATQLGRKKRIEQDYELGEVIGKGKFGSVVKCRNRANGEEFACKTLKKGEEIVHREVEIMQHLSGHPGIVTLKAVYEDAESFYLVMELCSGGRLLDQMAKKGRYSEYQAATLIKDILLAVRYCHEMGVVHRDIKPENILLTTSGELKIADFGLAARISDGQNLTGKVGSPAYVAPEVLVGDYSEKVDIWSVGVLLHALLVGELPFQGDSLEAVFEAIKKENLDFSMGIWECVSQSARDLISRMLTRDVSVRFSARKLLRHPWIMFYTEPRLKTLTFRQKCQSNLTLTCRQVTDISGMESERDNLVAYSSLNDEFNPIELTDAYEGEDAEVVDVLTVAISRVRISEPKRSRLCSPAQPIQQGCSSNMNAGNLCAAF